MDRCNSYESLEEYDADSDESELSFDYSIPDDEIELPSDDVQLPVDSMPTSSVPVVAPIPVIPPVIPPIPIVVPIPTSGDDSEEDEGGVSAPPTPPVLKSSTPTIITLNEIDEFNGSGAGYIPAGQFTEARAFPLFTVKASNSSKGIPAKMILTKNQRADYNYSPLSNELLRFPYWVPANADLSTLPPPEIDWLAYAISVPGQTNNVGSVTIEALDFTSGGSVTFNYNLPFGNQIVGSDPNGNLRTLILNSTQMLSFQKGQFNDFFFRIKLAFTSGLNAMNASGNHGISWQIHNVRTSLPPSHEFEFKLQENWTSYFGIDVVKNTDRTQKGSVTGVTNNPITTGCLMAGQPFGGVNGWSYTAPWRNNSYDVGSGFTHWEIPVNTFPGNKNYDLPIIVWPDNTDFCSMEPSLKTPGPQAPWNLLSRHETFWYAPHRMRKSDYSQQITSTATFYCPRNWKAITYLKNGVASNDVL